MSGVATVMSGHPFSLNYDYEGDYDGSGEFFGRPDVVGPIQYNYSNPAEFLDLTSFAVPCTLVGGNADSNRMLGNTPFRRRGPQYLFSDLTTGTWISRSAK